VGIFLPFHHLNFSSAEWIFRCAIDPFKKETLERRKKMEAKRFYRLEIDSSESLNSYISRVGSHTLVGEGLRNETTLNPPIS
jgi:hypothetical protein